MRFQIPHPNLHLVIIGFLLAWSFATSVQSQEIATPTVSDEAVKQLSKIKLQLEADANLDPSTKTKILADVVAAEQKLDSIAAKNTELKQLESAIETAEQRAAEFQSEFETLKSKEREIVDSDIPSEALATQIQELRTQTETLKVELKKNEESSNERNIRKKDSRQTIEALTIRIGELSAQLEQAPVDESLAAQAALLKLKTDLPFAELEKARLQTELKRDDAEQQFGLLQHQHDVIELKLTRRENVLKQLEEIQRKRLESKAQQSLQAARTKEAEAKDSEDSKKLLLSSYEENTRLAELVFNTEQSVTDTKANAEKLKELVKSLKKKFRDTEVRVKEIGLTESVGALLRKRRAELIKTANAGSLNDDAKSRIDKLQYELFDIDQKREDISPKLIRLEIENANGPQTPEIWRKLDVPINEVIELRKEEYAAYKASLDRLFPYLLDVQQFDKSRRKTTLNFREYINERILWIRSNDILFSEINLDDSDLNALSPAKWSEAGVQILQVLGLVAIEQKAQVAATSVAAENQDRPPAESTIREAISTQASSASSYFRSPMIAVGALICFLLIFSKSRMRKEVDRLGVQAARGSCVSFWPTARSLFFTILIALALPLVALLLGIAIIYAPFQGSGLFYAIGQSLIRAGLFAFPAEVLRRLTRPQGIGNRHFDWPDSSVARLKKNLDWIVLPGSLLVFTVSLLHNLDLSHRIDMLERIIFICGMISATYFLYQIYNAKTGVFSEHLRAHENSWANQTSALWMGSILFIPLSLAFLAFWGFYYTALNLAECAYATLVFTLVIETIRGLARRFVLVRRRNAFIQTAKRKRLARIESAKAKREEEQAAAAAGATPIPEMPASPSESIEALTEIQPEEIEKNVKQAYKLISMGLLLVWAIGIWMIWTDVLPALKALDDYTLWPNQVVENGFESPAVSSETQPADAKSDGSSSGDVAPSPMIGMPAAESGAVSASIHRVTVRDLLLFIVISIVTWIAATNLPNAFEILFLEELPFDRSLRYAIKALTSYAIVMLGVLLAFRALSIGWSNVQWLATALTFGLAFGLQEIFANFVAGIILMFERPMRIGDLITVDEFTGVVTKIRTRATTIINWDRKEYVIPNKDFITGRLVNWTLSDAINRIELTVGIAYGSNVELAKSTLYKVLKEHPKVVDEPPSQVIFNEFGESSLNILVRCFIGDIDSRPLVNDSLHTQINNAFNEAGIEISFPQRDLNLRTIDGPASEAIAALAKGSKNS